MRVTSRSRGELEQGRLPLLQGREVVRLVVGAPFLPAAEEDADPLEGEGAEGSVTAGALFAGALIEGLCPEGLGDALCGPLDEGLSKEGVAGEAPVDPV